MNMDEKKLLEEAKALDEAYMSSALHDANFQIKYLEKILKTLVDNINEDIPREQGTDHLWAAVEDAEEALGYHDVTPIGE